MSASVPSLLDNSGEKERPFSWLALSVAAHAAILGWIIYVIPPVQIASQDSAQANAESAVSVTPDRVEQVAKEIQTTQAEEVRSKVEELLATKETLATIEAQKEKDFTTLAGEMAVTAPQIANDAVTDAAKAQEEAEKAQKEAIAAAETFKMARKTADATVDPAARTAAEAQVSTAAAKVASAQERAKNAQAAATTAQTNASQQLGFRAETSFAEAKAAENAAAAAQEEANNKQDEAATALAQRDNLRREANKAQNRVVLVQRQIDLQKARLSQTHRTLDRAQGFVQKDQDKLSKLRQMPPSQADRQKSIDDAEASLARNQEQVTKNQADIDKGTAVLADLHKTLAVAQTDAEKAATNLAQHPDTLRDLQTEALKKQQDARTFQTRAQAAIAKATIETAQSTPLVASTPPPEAVPAPSNPPDLDSKTLAELYAMAVATEKQVADAYKNIRAVDTAVLRKIPVSEATKYVQAALPERPDLTPALARGNVQTSSELEKQKAAIENAIQQINSILALVRGMQSQAQGSGDQGVTISASSMKVQAHQASQLASIATDYQNGNYAADLTAIMKQIQSGEIVNAPEVQTVNGVDPAHPTSPVTSGATATGGATASGPGPQGGTGVGTAIYAQGFGVGPRGFPAPGAVLDSVPGRKIHAPGNGDGGAKWMYLDTWYVIGPFPNPQRRNIDTRFPPESVVDLDAVYAGKDDQPVRWRFVQANQAGVHPPLEQNYSIYYAYTTLWLDEERDLWIAVGSDDFSKLWMNEMLVWASGPRQKTWRANEGYRKVHLKKGLNRVLYRIENGRSSCIFSLMINLDPEAGA